MDATLLRDSNLWRWLWDAYVVVGCLGAIVVVALLEDGGGRVGASVAIAAVGVWALTFGRAHLHEREFGRGSALFVAVSVLLTAVALLFSLSAVAALPVLYPLVFMPLPLSAALIITTGMNVLPITLGLFVVDLDREVRSTVLAVSCVALLLTPVIGITITKAVQLSEDQSKLLAELTASRAETARLSHEAGIGLERARLAREIHDTLAQGFTSIITLAQAVESEFETEPVTARRHIELIRTTARENLVEARAMVEELSPPDRSLVESVQRLTERMRAESGIEVELTADPALPVLGRAAEVVLLRATQEGLANVRRHSNATAATVELVALDNTVRLTLADNGIGLGDAAEGFGLRGMRERAEQVGGTMAVTSSEAAGTTVTVSVPS